MKFNEFVRITNKVNELIPDRLEFVYVQNLLVNSEPMVKFHFIEDHEDATVYDFYDRKEGFIISARVTEETRKRLENSYTFCNVYWVPRGN